MWMTSRTALLCAFLLLLVSTCDDRPLVVHSDDAPSQRVPDMNTDPAVEDAGASPQRIPNERATLVELQRLDPARRTAREERALADGASSESRGDVSGAIDAYFVALAASSSLEAPARVLLLALEVSHPVAFHTSARRWCVAFRGLDERGGPLLEPVRAFFELRHYQDDDLFAAPMASQIDGVKEASFRHALGKHPEAASQQLVCVLLSSPGERSGEDEDPPPALVSRLAGAARRITIGSRCPRTHAGIFRVGIQSTLWLEGERARVIGFESLDTLNARGFVLTLQLSAGGWRVTDDKTTWRS